MICRAGERVRVRVEGIPLGLLEDREYDEVKVKLEPDDLVVLYSDGVQDQLNRSDEEYGTARLFKAVKKRCNLAPSEIVQGVFADIDEHTNGGPMTDDQSLIAIKIN
jgi:sigma-B regulation protein RsbU (phosphoserine phosphatase)